MHTRADPFLPKTVRCDAGWRCEGVQGVRPALMQFRLREGKCNEGGWGLMLARGKAAVQNAVPNCSAYSGEPAIACVLV